MQKLSLAVAAVLVGLTAGQALAQTQSRTGQSPGTPTARSSDSQAPASDPDEGQASETGARELPAADKAFALKAAASGMTEVQLGQLAVQKGGSTRMKQFGTRMAVDHGQANQELQQILDEAGVEMPTQPDPRAAGTLQRLRGITGTDFDPAFAQAVVQMHRSDIAEFRREAQSGKDPALKAFAQKYLPALLQHLQMAQSLGAPT